MDTKCVVKDYYVLMSNGYSVCQDIICRNDGSYERNTEYVTHTFQSDSMDITLAPNSGYMRYTIVAKVDGYFIVGSNAPTFFRANETIANSVTNVGYYPVAYVGMQVPPVNP